jgi:hypothetical protein
MQGVGCYRSHYRKQAFISFQRATAMFAFLKKAGNTPNIESQAVLALSTD